MTTLKRITLLAIALVMAISIAACKDTTQNDATHQPTATGELQTDALESPNGTASAQNLILPSNMKEDVYISLLGLDSEMIMNYRMANFIMFELVSKFEIETISISADTVIEVGVAVSPVANDYENEMPYYVLQAYNGIDWQRLYELEEAYRGENNPSSLPNSDAAKAFQEYDHMYWDDWRRIRDEAEAPPAYFYDADIYLDPPDLPDGENSYANVMGIDGETLSEITLTINGEDYVFDIGEIKLDYTTQALDIINSKFFDGNDEVDWPLICTEIGSSGGSMYPNSEGWVNSYSGPAFDVTQDGATIVDVRVFGGDISDVEANLVVTFEDGRSIDMLFDKANPITFEAGTSFEVDLKFKDGDFAGKLYHHDVYWFVVDYEFEGETYSDIYEAGMGTHPMPYELYAHMNDGIDFFSYYDDYVVPIGKYD